MASIKQQPNGKWRYRIRYKENGNFREVSKSGFRTKRDAQSAANELETRISGGMSVYDGNMLIKDYLDVWIKLKEKQVKKSTLLKINRSFRLYVLPKFGFCKISDIKRLDCIEWINELCERLNIDSVKSYAAPFNNALEDAVSEYKIIITNPMKNIKYPRNEKRKKDVQFFELEDLKKLLQISENLEENHFKSNYQYHVLTTLLARTGLRLGEALSLNWTDIDNNTLIVSKTLYRENGKDYITSPKTDSSYRVIALDNKTVDLLKSLKLKKLKYNMADPDYVLNKELIFSDHDGVPLKQSSYRSYFYKICKLADVPVLSPHALRHSHAVHLLESGANIKYVSERLGHATINMTANVYLHVSKKIEREAISMYENYF
ncbi:site-specific integrase [Enterococcus faecium]|uniref:site-specific integrase n=1 Tax=Enterococcus faecium TaxID=1352 RepID=UPI000BEF7EB8|nr:site-specific integrase [Enterococcus faecium]PEH49345.1 site-specific integrase [Enterococcus faecium]